MSITKSFPKEYSFLAKYHDEKDYYQIIYDKFKHFLRQINNDTDMTLGRLPKIKFQLKSENQASTKRTILSRTVCELSKNKPSAGHSDEELSFSDTHKSSSDEDFNIEEEETKQSKSKKIKRIRKPISSSHYTKYQAVDIEQLPSIENSLNHLLEHNKNQVIPTNIFSNKKYPWFNELIAMDNQK